MATAGSEKSEPLVGVGIYTIAEAARISAVSAQRIRRWLRGYAYAAEAETRHMPPVWTPQHTPIDGQRALGFRDLLEVRFVDGFRRAGVGWRAIRTAAARAREFFGDTHPFSTAKFKTDGKRIFAEVRQEADEPIIIELAKRQHYFRQIIAPYLKGIEWEDDEPVRWWPMGPNKAVVIDPARSFGQPIAADSGVPTAVLAKALDAAGSVDAVAVWYEVSPRSVKLAVEYERSLAA